ncbi:MAG: hypothetical protein JXQ90_20660 [Cyclobacteriaceae bacterium]
MTKFSLSLYLLSHLFVSCWSKAQENYLNYHSKVILCEQLIAEGKSASAIDMFDSLFNQFDFLFLRDIKVATELSVYVNDYESSLKFIKLGIMAGWTLKSINKNDNLRPLTEHLEWVKILYVYDSLHSNYLSGLNFQVKEQAHEMFKKDQKKALGALIRIGQNAQIKYAENKFAPHSEKQLQMLDNLLYQYGYPGEQLIGNRLWVSVILSHHNSISPDYCSKDTLYEQLRPKLLEAMKQGEMSPYELAQIEDWRTAVLTGHELSSFGFIGKIPSIPELKMVNYNRAEIGLRSIELRNKLIDIEKSTGLNLYLPKGWQKGKITVANK